MAGVYEVTIEGLIYQQVFNIRRFYYYGGGDPPSYGAFANAFGNGLRTVIEDLVHDNTSFNSIHIRSVAVGQVGADYIPSNWPFNGTVDAAEGLPPFCALSIRYGGALQQYPVRGFSRFPGQVEADQNAGVWTNATFTAWGAVANHMKTSFTLGSGGNSWSPVLYNPNYLPQNAIGSAVVQGYVTTQNSRKVGRGA